MTQSSWTSEDSLEELTRTRSGFNFKLLIPVAFLFLAVIFLANKALKTEGQFFVTIDEYFERPGKYSDRDVRLSAYVLGDSIAFTQIDATSSRLEFDIADNPADPTQIVHVVAFNEPIPDLLQHEAQAIIEGHIGEDGSLYANADRILLKCPTRYEEGAPTK